jgi:hypothetical protein
MMVSAQLWKDVAELCVEEIAAAARGKREAAFDRAIERLAKLTPPVILKKQTLRTAMLAYRFVKRVEADDVALAKILHGMPAIAVETVARWYARDKKSAGDSARQFAAGNHTIRSLAAAENKSRPKSGSLYGVALKSRYQKLILERMPSLDVVWTRPDSGITIRSVLNWKKDKVIQSDVPVSATGTMTVNMRRNPASLSERPTEFLSDLLCAVLIVGPYSSTDLYELRAGEWCLRALGLTFFHTMVALVLPDGDAHGRFRTILERSAEGRVLLLADKA